MMMFRRPLFYAIPIALVALAVVAALLALQGSAPVLAHQTQFYLDCPITEVLEGESVDVFLVRDIDHQHPWETFGAYWHTDAGTADTSDYHHQNGVEVWANQSERRANRAKRTFVTKEDNLSEGNETFTVRFSPVNMVTDRNDPARDEKCVVTIIDDDGVGIHDLEIISSPADGYAYRVGERIEILARFNGEVNVAKPVILSMNFSSGESWWRGARLEGRYPAEENSYVFIYKVQPGDMDLDGIKVLGSYSDGGVVHGLGGDGSVTDAATGDPINPWFRGLEPDPAHRVIARPSATAIEIISSPVNGRIYAAGESIEIAMTFDEAVEVEGSVVLPLRMGTGSWWRGARYDRGSGTDTLVFSYEIQADDLDVDGVSMDGGYTDKNGVTHSFGGNGRIVSAAHGGRALPHYPGLAHQPAHRVGITHVTDVRITSTPATGDTYDWGETIQVTVDFSRPVDVRDADNVNLNLTVGSGNWGWRRANYVSGSGTATLVFEYTVRQNNQSGEDFDDDGVGVGFEHYGGLHELFDLVDAGRIVASGTDTDADVYWLTSTTAPGHRVDGITRVESVAITSDPGPDNTYGAGDRFDVVVTFSAPINDLVGPPPRFELDFDGTLKVALATSQTDDLLRFTYVIQVGDTDRNGIAIMANPIRLVRGTTIENTSGGAANLGHPAIPSDPRHKVNAPGGL